MPVEVPGTPTYHATVTCPADGDSVAGSAPTTMGTDLADRTQYLKGVVDGIVSGTYTPTFSNVTNLSGVTDINFKYTRNGDIVTVIGGFNATATGAGLKTADVTLPVDPSANFSVASEAQGHGISTDATGFAYAVAATKTVQLSGNSTASSGLLGFGFTFMYEL